MTVRWSKLGILPGSFLLKSTIHPDYSPSWKSICPFRVTQSIWSWRNVAGALLSLQINNASGFWIVPWPADVFARKRSDSSTKAGQLAVFAEWEGFRQTSFYSFLWKSVTSAGGFIFDIHWQGTKTLFISPPGEMGVCCCPKINNWIFELHINISLTNY